MKDQKKIQLFEHTPVPKAVLTMAIPTILSSLVMVIYNLADTYFVGFWNDKGICGGDIMDFLGGLHGKQVALFGTCGMGEDRSYCRQVARRVAALIPEDNRYLGSFMCSGKLSFEVLKKYRFMQKKEDSPWIRKMIQAYEEAMLHPDENDLKNARAFAEEIVSEKKENIYGDKRR